MSENKRKKILIAAQGLFDRFGLKKTTVDEIARHAGIGKGTVYLYFKSKEEIFLEVRRREYIQVLDQYKVIMQSEPDGLERLIGITKTRVGMITAMLKKNPLNPDIIVESHMEQEYIVVRDEFEASECSLIREILENSDFVGQDLDKAVRSFSVLLDGVTLGIVLKKDGIGDADFLEYLVKSCVYGMRACS